MRNKFIKTLLTFVTTFLILSVAAFAAQKAKIKRDGAEIYAKPSDLSDVISTVNKGEIISIGLLKNGFFKTRVDEKLGWVSEEDVEVGDISTEPTEDSDKVQDQEKAKDKKDDSDEDEEAKKPVKKSRKTKSSSSVKNKYSLLFRSGLGFINPVMLNESYKQNTADLNAITSDMELSLGLGYKLSQDLKATGSIDYITNFYPKIYTHNNRISAEKYDDETNVTVVAPSLGVEYDLIQSSNLSLHVNAKLGYTLIGKASRTLTRYSGTTLESQSEGTITLKGATILFNTNIGFTYNIFGNFSAGLDLGYRLLKLSGLTAEYTQNTLNTSVVAGTFAATTAKYKNYAISEINFSGLEGALQFSYSF